MKTQVPYSFKIQQQHIKEAAMTMVKALTKIVHQLKKNIIKYSTFF